MTGRRTLASLGTRLSQESRENARLKATRMTETMDLSEIRRAHTLSQKQIAEVLNIGQASVARLEKRTDMYISTLRSYIEAMGGELDIIARFPGHDVKIESFTRIGDPAEG